MVNMHATRLLLTAGEAPVSERGREREAAILRVASEQFLEHGYAGTSFDAIARLAGGSKSTLYRFFPTKGDLFQAVVASVVADRHREPLDAHGDVATALLAFSRERLRVVFTRRHWSLLRLIMAERDRFPRVAAAYYELGPLHSTELLASYFQQLADRRVLRIENPQFAAKNFIGMLMHDWYLRYLLVATKLPSKEERQTRAESVVESFLAAHRFDK